MEVYDKIKKIFMEMGFEESELAPDVNIQEDLELDSTEFAALCAAIKKNFDMKVFPHNFETLNDLEKLIKNG